MTRVDQYATYYINYGDGEARMHLAEMVKDIGNNFLFQNLASSVVWVAALAGLVLFRRRKHRQWWSLKAGEGNVIRLVQGTLPPVTTPLGYTYSTTTINDAAATVYTALGISAAYQDRYTIRTHDSTHFSQAFWDDIVILIGGRVRNPATRELFGALESRWEFPYAIEDAMPTMPRKIVRSHDGSQFTADFDSNGNIVRDWALLCRLPNPFSPRKKAPVFVLYGLHAFGVLGAARLLTPEYLGQLSGMRKSDWCEILLSVDVHNEEVYPRVVEGLALKSLT